MSNLREECEVVVHGVPARAYPVIQSQAGHLRILNQTIKATREYTEGEEQFRMAVELRFDDQCKNGHESFSITADIRRAERGAWREYSNGCCHDEIAKVFPEWAHLIAWHLTSADGPMRYIANTVYHAGDRDCYGLRKGERRQIKNGKTGELCWHLEAKNPGPGYLSKTPTGNEYADREHVPMFILGDYHDGECPTVVPTLEWVPLWRHGEGKERDLNAARHCAVWPDATDEELMQEPEELKKALAARLPALMARFKADMVAAGMIYPTWREQP